MNCGEANEILKHTEERSKELKKIKKVYNKNLDLAKTFNPGEISIWKNKIESITNDQINNRKLRQKAKYKLNSNKCK